jgi:heme exporter protein A
VIRARGLTKRYGDKRVLEALDLDVARGGFLLVTGPNGAGKTTLLRLIAGLAAPTRGELAVEAERSAVGFLSHESLLYRELTPLENLERIGMLLERFGLWDERHERVGTFSRGMVQRLALCRTLLHQPELVLLDEPFAGLDADGSELVDRELRELVGSATVVLATHLPERLDPLAPARLALPA